MPDLSNHIALVTGASRGIGAATAKAMAEAGATVVLVARTQADLEVVAKEIREKGGKANVFPADLANSDEVSRVNEEIKTQVGVPDILVNNAGLGRWLFVEETPPQEAEMMIKLPYLAAFWMCSFWIPHMKDRGSGRILNVNSPVSIVSWGGAAGYASSRWALRGLSESLRIDLRGSGIHPCHAVFGEVSSNYWKANPGARERLPAISKLIPVLKPEQVAKELVQLAGNRKKTAIYPWLLGVFKFFNQLAPWLIRFLITKTSFSNK